MEWFDKEKIMSDADSYQIAQALGMDTRRKGNYVFIRCPGHADRIGHEDTKIGNAYLTPKGYHCCACGITVNAIKMVMEYTNCSYAEALEQIAEINGGKEQYYDEEKMNSSRNKNRKRKNTVPKMISYEDQRMIGLNPDYKKTCFPVSYSDVPKKGYKRNEKRGRTCYLKNSFASELQMSLTKLYREDYDTYCGLVVLKCLETIDRYEFVRDHLTDICFFCPELNSEDMQIGLKYVIKKDCDHLWDIINILMSSDHTVHKKKGAA